MDPQINEPSNTPVNSGGDPGSPVGPLPQNEPTMPPTDASGSPAPVSGAPSPAYNQPLQTPQPGPDMGPAPVAGGPLPPAPNFGGGPTPPAPSDPAQAPGVMPSNAPAAPAAGSKKSFPIVMIGVAVVLAIAILALVLL